MARIRNQIDHRRNFFERLAAGQVDLPPKYEIDTPEGITPAPTTPKAARAQRQQRQRPVGKTLSEREAMNANKPSLAQQLGMIPRKKTMPRIEVDINPANLRAVKLPSLAQQAPPAPKVQPWEPLPVVQPEAADEPAPVQQPVPVTEQMQSTTDEDPLFGQY